MILSDKDLGTVVPAELNLTEDMKVKVGLLATLNNAMRYHEANFYHHAARLRAALESLEEIESCKKRLYGEVTK